MFRFDHLDQVVCHHLQGSQVCEDCAVAIELPSGELLREAYQPVGRIDFVRQLAKSLPFALPKRIQHREMNLTPAEYATLLVRENSNCVQLATTSDQVADLDVSLKELVETGKKCIRRRKPDDCRCKTHDFVNVYAKVVQLFVDRMAACLEFAKLNPRDMMKHMQFIFPRYVSYNVAYYNWTETEEGKSGNSLFRDLEFLVEPKLLEAVNDIIDDGFLSDEEFELLGTVLLFEAGPELSPAGRVHLQICQKAYLAVLSDHFRTAYSDFSQEELIIRLWQHLQVSVNLGVCLSQDSNNLALQEMADDLSRSLILATAFDRAKLRGNLSFDLHLREH